MTTARPEDPPPAAMGEPLRPPVPPAIHDRINRSAVVAALVGLLIVVSVLQTPKPLPTQLKSALVAAAISLGCVLITTQPRPVSKTSRARSARLATAFVIGQAAGVIATLVAVFFVLNYLYTPAAVVFVILAMLSA